MSTNIFGGDPLGELAEQTTDESIDRGDDFEAKTLEDQVLEGQEAQTEAEIPTSAETSAETPADNGEKHDIRIPKARFDEVNEQRKQLLAKLQALEAEKQAKNVQAGVDFDALEDQYAEALMDGGTDKAKAIRTTIREAELALAERIAKSQAPVLTQQMRDQVEFDSVVAESNRTYPVFDPEAPDFRQDLVDEAVMLSQTFSATGLSNAAALKKAVDYVAKYHGLDPKAGGSGKSSGSVNQKLAVASRQPPVQRGQSNKQTEPDYRNLTDEEFNALPKATLARLRGDLV